MKQNRILLIITFLWLMYMGLLRRYIFSNEIISFIPDILVFYISYRSLRRTHSQSIAKNTFGKALPWTFCFLLLFSIIGAALNTLNLLSYFWGIRMVIRYPLLMWCIIVNFNKKYIERYIKIVYYTFFVNIFFCFLQIIEGNKGDGIGGTFGDNGSLLLIALVTFVLASIDYYSHKLKLWKYLIVIAGMFLIAIWAEIKIMYFLFPILSYGIYILHNKFNIKHFMIIALAYILLVPTMQFFMSFYYDKQYVQKVFDIDFINKETSHSYAFMEGGFNRQTAIPMASKILFDNDRLLMGYGLGSGSMSSYFKTELTNKYFHTTFWFFSTSYCLIEMGWIGFILYSMCYVFLAYRFFLFYNKTNDPSIKYWAAIGLATTIATFLLAWYNDTPYFNYLPLYFLWGVCLAAIQLAKNNNLYISNTIVYIGDDTNNINYSASI